HVDIVVAVLHRQARRPDHRLVFAEIDVAQVAIPCARDAAPRPCRIVPQRFEPAAYVLLEEVAQEADALPGLAVQLSALRPPDEVFAVRIGLAVSGIATAHDGHPEAVHQLLGGDVPPGIDDVALIFGFVVHHRLAIGLSPFRRALYVPILDADVTHPRLP